MVVNYTTLPGGDLIRVGIEGLKAGIESPQVLLVAIGRPRLSRLHPAADRSRHGPLPV